MDRTEYRKLRRSMTPRAILAEKERRRRFPPGPAFRLTDARIAPNGAEVYHVTSDAIPMALTVALAVSYDDFGETIQGEIEGAGFHWQEAGRYDPTDKEKQERPHHCAVIAEVGGYHRTEYVWVWFDPAELHAPSGMARGPAEDYRRAEARCYAVNMAKHAEDRANGRRAEFHVHCTIAYRGEELHSDSLGGIDAEGAEEAARYYWAEYGSAEAADTIADWQAAARTAMQERAARLEEKAAALRTEAAALAAGGDQ